MAGKTGPDGTGKTGPERAFPGSASDDDLDRRRRRLDAALAAQRQERAAEGASTGSRSSAGYAVAFRLSSEFIAAIAVGIGIGWMIDRLAGSSPWGLVVFLLLGFAAGVLNVLRASGLVAGFGESRRGTGGNEK